MFTSSTHDSNCDGNVTMLEHVLQTSIFAVSNGTSFKSVEGMLQWIQSHKLTLVHQNHEKWFISWAHSSKSDGDVTILLHTLIGASLSEPHTSVTALRKCVCMLACLRPYTVNFKWAHLNISRRLNKRPQIASCPACCRGRTTARTRGRRERNLEQRRLKLMHPWQLRTVTDKGRLLKGGTNYTQYSWDRLRQGPCIINTHNKAPEIQFMTSLWSLVQVCV